MATLNITVVEVTVADKIRYEIHDGRGNVLCEQVDEGGKQVRWSNRAGAEGMVSVLAEAGAEPLYRWVPMA